MQQELKYIQQEVGITFIFVTHDQEEALTMSDKIVVMNAGEIQQIGTPTEIYRYPVNEFVANFIGETNIIDGVMQGDDLVVFEDKKFPCRARGFNKNEKVDVVIRPEHLDIVPRSEGMLKGVVKCPAFQGDALRYRGRDPRRHDHHRQDAGLAGPPCAQCRRR